MIDEEKEEFVKLINVIAAIYDKQLTEIKLKGYWEFLKGYSIADVKSGINSHIKNKEEKFFPLPSQIIAGIPSFLHIGGDEAWAIALTSFDESETVVITKEIEAARAISLPIWADGDKISARMTFKDSYRRIIKDSGEPVSWKVSLGADKDKRLPAIEKAKQLGRLPSDYSHPDLVLGQNISASKLIDMAFEKTNQSASTCKVRIREILRSTEKDGIRKREKERQSFEIHRQMELSKLSKIEEKTCDASPRKLCEDNVLSKMGQVTKTAPPINGPHPVPKNSDRRAVFGQSPVP